MIKLKKLERRRYPRIKKRLPLKIAANGYAFSTTTDNISCIGAYCHINKYIPPFTKIALRLRLPVTSAYNRGVYNVECKGVIVRTDDTSNSGFNIAIFFNKIKNDQRKVISEYISQFLPKKSSTPKR
jgi:hypothetical protein